MGLCLTSPIIICRATDLDTYYSVVRKLACGVANSNPKSRAEGANPYVDLRATSAPRFFVRVDPNLIVQSTAIVRVPTRIYHYNFEDPFSF